METTSRADFQQWDLERKKPAAKRELMDLKVKMDPTTTYSGNFVDHKVSGGARRCGSGWRGAWSLVALAGAGLTADPSQRFAGGEQSVRPQQEHQHHAPEPGRGETARTCRP